MKDETNSQYLDGTLLADDEIDDSNCRALWAAVLVQACIDARTQSPKRENVKVKAEALAWLAQENPDSDFETVCEMANLEPSLVRKNLKKFLRHDGGLTFHCVRKERPQRRRRKKAQQSTIKGETYEQLTKEKDCSSQ